MSESKILINEIIAIAWFDKTSFTDIYAPTDLSESDTSKLRRRNLKQSIFRLWRKRVLGRKTKHKKIGAVE